MTITEDAVLCRNRIRIPEALFLCRATDEQQTPTLTLIPSFLHTFQLRLGAFIKHNTLAACSMRSFQASLSVRSITEAVVIVEPKVRLSTSSCQHPFFAPTVCACSSCGIHQRVNYVQPELDSLAVRQQRRVPDRHTTLYIICTGHKRAPMSPFTAFREATRRALPNE
jgi:hypothetical protein